jgi:dodecin
MSVKMHPIVQRTPEGLKGGDMAASSGSVYDVIEVIGTSTESWEKAGVIAVETAAKSLRDLRIAEVVEMDMQIDDGKVRAFRTKVKLSFKYEKKG